MTLKEFINTNRTDLCKAINRVVGFVPRQASCNCWLTGKDHYHDDTNSLSNAEIRQWILNDEGLYRWAKSEGVKI